MGVAYIPGTHFYAVPDTHHNTMRLNFSNATLENIEKGMTILKELFISQGLKYFVFQEAFRMKIERRKASLSDAEILWENAEGGLCTALRDLPRRGQPGDGAAFPHAGAVGAERDELLLYPGGWGACRSDPRAGLAG